MKSTIKNKLVLALATLTGMLASIPAFAVCELSLPATTPTDQFAKNLDGTVTDLNRGLMWKQCLEGMTASTDPYVCSGNPQTFNWEAALLEAQTVNTDPNRNMGYDDWRIPNIKELQSIVEHRCWQPATNPEVFPNDPGGFLWSSTAYNNYPGSMWHLAFNYGAIVTSQPSNARNIRLVRFAKQPSLISRVPDAFGTPQCDPNCTYPYDWGVVRTFTYNLPANATISNVVISGTWGDPVNFDSSAGVEIYLDGVRVAECIELDLCWDEDDYYFNWTFDFSKQGGQNWQANFVDGVANLSLIQTSRISVNISDIKLEIMIE